MNLDRGEGEAFLTSVDSVDRPGSCPLKLLRRNVLGMVPDISSGRRSAQPAIYNNWGTALQEDATSLKGMVFEQVLPGEQLRRERHHISISSEASIPDASVLQLSEHAQAMAASGLAGSGMSAAKLLAADALYKLEPMLCEQLNQHLEQSVFGPFENVGSAVFHLLQLQRKRKAAKAQQLHDLLSTFADAHHGSIECLLQWPELLRLKKERDAFAHPLDIPHEHLAGGNKEMII